MNIYSVEDIRTLISFLASSLILLVSMIYKVPQIIGIIRTKNSKGLVYESLLMELLSLNISIGFCFSNNYSILLYGENISNLI